MGKLEQEAKTERRRGYIQQAVLAAVGVAGVLALTAVAPGAIPALKAFGLDKRLKDKTRSAVNRLARKGHITFVERGGKKQLRITEAGRRELQRAELAALLAHGPRKPRRWDKRWRLIVFDIPERRRAIRNKLRRVVRTLGFLRMQDSVWVYPYDCEELVVLLKADLRVGKDVLYAIVEKIENDGWIREHFNLPT